MQHTNLNVEANEQNSRLNAVRLINAQPLPRDSNSDQHVVNILREHLGNHLGINLSLSDIDISHPLGPPRNNKQNFIIKFVRRSVKNTIFRTKKYFAESNSGVINTRKTFICEDLTTMRRNMMKLFIPS